MKGVVVLTALLAYTAAALPQSNSSVLPATTAPQLSPLPQGTPATCYETVLTATLTCQYCEWVSTTSSASSGAVRTTAGVPTGSALSGSFVSSYVVDGITRSVWSIASRSAQWTAAPPPSGIPAYSPSSWSSMLQIASTSSSRAVSIVPTATATPVYKPVINITEIASACPSYNDTFVVSNGGGVYLIECGIDHKDGDFYNNPFRVGDYAECLLTCDTHSTCKAIAYVAGTPGFCYLKAEIMDGVPVSSVWGASRVQNQAPTATASPTPSILSTLNKPSVLPGTAIHNATQINVSSTIYSYSVLTIGTHSPSQSKTSVVPVTSIRNATQINVSSTIYPHSVLTIGTHSPSQSTTSVVPVTSIRNGTQSVVPSTLPSRNDTRSTTRKSRTVMTTTITRTIQTSISSMAGLINGTSSTMLPTIVSGAAFTSTATMTRALNGSLCVLVVTDKITQTQSSATSSAIAIPSGSYSSGLVGIPTTINTIKKQTLDLPSTSNKVNITQSLLLPTLPVSSFPRQTPHLPTTSGMRESRKSQSLHLPTSEGVDKARNSHSLHPSTRSKISGQRIQSLRLPTTTTPFSVDIRSGIATVTTTDYITVSIGTPQATVTYGRFTTVATTYITHKQPESSSVTAKTLLPGTTDLEQKLSLTISPASLSNLRPETLTASTDTGANGGYTLVVPSILTTTYTTSDVSPASSRLPSLRLSESSFPTDLPLDITTVTVEDAYTVTLPFPLDVTAPPNVPVNDGTVAETAEDILTTIAEDGIEYALTVPAYGPVGYTITLPTTRIPSHLTAGPKFPEPSATDVAPSTFTKVTMDEVTYSGAIATLRKVTMAPNLPKTKTRNHHHHSGTHRHPHHDWSTPAPSANPCTLGDLGNLNATSIDQLFQVVKKLQEKVYNIKKGICDSGKRGSASGYENVTDRLPPDVLQMFKTGQINYYHENGDFVYYVSLNESSVITPVTYDTNEYIDVPDEAECGACFEDNTSADVRQRVQCEADCRPVVRRLNKWNEVSIRAHWRHNAKVGVVEYKGSVVLPPDHRGIALDDETTPAAQPATNLITSTTYTEGGKDVEDDENELLSASLSKSAFETSSAQKQDIHTIFGASNRVTAPTSSASGVLGSIATVSVASGLKIAASAASSTAAQATGSLSRTSKEGTKYTTWTSWGLSSGATPATSLRTSKSSTTAKPSRSSVSSSSKTSSRTSTTHPSPTKHSAASGQTRTFTGALMILVGVLGVLLL